MAGPTINRERLKELIAQQGRAWREVSLSAGLSETGVRDIINGRSKNPTITTIAGLAEVLQIGMDALLIPESGEEPDIVEAAGYAAARPGTLPLKREARPNVWLEPVELDDDDGRRAAAPVDPRWPRKAQWLSLVRGDSMNDVRRGDACVGLVDGDLAQIVDAEVAGYIPTTGDIVEVKRTRGDGTAEISIKQVEVTHDGKVLLWSRSGNRRWKDPLEVTSEDEIETRIIGKVVRLLREL